MNCCFACCTAIIRNDVCPQVAPAELEAVLLSHPLVTDAAVIGIPNQEAGELPKAFVVPSGGVTPSEIAAFVNKKVSPYKKLRGGVEFVREIPKTASGKILRREILKNEMKKLKQKL